jgi:multiple sugar transport system ATP-binding protein
MRTELSKLHERLETTFIYVTHDQVEAMTMATRLAVLKDGLLQQVGTPEDLYFRPDNVFVAGFIGSPSMNFFRGRLVLSGDDRVSVQSEGLQLLLPEERGRRVAALAGKEVIFGIRPEDIYDRAFVPGDIRTQEVPVRVEINEMVGNERLLHVRADSQAFLARVDPRTRARAGEQISTLFDSDRIHLFSLETERALDAIEVPGLEPEPDRTLSLAGG